MSSGRMRQALQQKMLQKLSPQQIQFIKLLQIPTDLLEQRIKEELEVNPALEEGGDEMVLGEYEFEEDYVKQKEAEAEGDDYAENPSDNLDFSDYLEGDDTPDYKLQDYNYSDDDENDRSVPIVVDASFHENLMQQLGTLDLDDRHYQMATQIIGSIDEDGYLRRTIESIVDDLAFSQNLMCEDEEVEELLLTIQEFEPAGVGARSLQECLLLQLNRKSHKTSAIKNAIIIVEEYFDEYTKKHFDKIEKSLEMDSEMLKLAHAEIIKLNPKPGNVDAGDTKSQQVIPDFIIHNNEGILELKLNARNAPELHVSSTYREMFKEYDKSAKKDKKLQDAATFVKQKLDSAKWFIDAVKQRQHTLLTTMEAIMEHQRAYFLSGNRAKLKPMILKDIAEKVSLDISTISRVANSKYVQTEYGTFLLKSFFAEGIKTESGEEASSLEVKSILEDAINAEDKSNPLSDDKLASILNEKGYNIARRTVAKYREALNIPVARLRKEL